ncbi:ribosomal protein L7/L12 [Pullulanibacillus pueri]|uniref:Ribosomal protein L7/L12 C-terminal domain-containing protein n=1 Tax=Pullulanibacillus pueri TaxID=1437324 RepID=A0A8J3EKW7_9BACL|nr:hypothetical protein [Pullulanibacillus pueri]MBM7681047.1 ribosomal protein L7/L12 [Pullulanibacillus pueri]GGH76833.1 hypothetical protein GCM10007096_07830 [Pullulanibacillus pueri]
MIYLLCSILLVFFILIVRVSEKLSTLDSRFKRIQTTLDQIAKQVNVPEDPINETIRALVKEGKTVEAVKETRKAFGFSLLEAKKYVDDFTHKGGS